MCTHLFLNFTSLKSDCNFLLHFDNHQTTHYLKIRNKPVAENVFLIYYVINLTLKPIYGPSLYISLQISTLAELVMFTFLLFPQKPRRLNFKAGSGPAISRLLCVIQNSLRNACIDSNMA